MLPGEEEDSRAGNRKPSDTLQGPGALCCVTAGSLVVIVTLLSPCIWFTVVQRVGKDVVCSVMTSSQNGQKENVVPKACWPRSRMGRSLMGREGEGIPVCAWAPGSGKALAWQKPWRCHAVQRWWGWGRCRAAGSEPLQLKPLPLPRRRATRRSRKQRNKSTNSRPSSRKSTEPSRQLSTLPFWWELFFWRIGTPVASSSSETSCSQPAVPSLRRHPCQPPRSVPISFAKTH